MRWLIATFFVLFLAACDLGPRPEVPDVDPDHILEYNVVAMQAAFAPNARIVGLPETDPERRREILGILEKSITDRMTAQMLPQFKGQKPAVLAVELLILTLPDPSTALTTNARDQLYGNIYLYDVETQEEIDASGVRINDFTFKAQGNVGALLTIAANNKQSYKRRFDKLAKLFTDRASLIFK